MDIKCLHDNVLIEIPKETKTKEGIHLPEATQMDRIAGEGKAVSVGPDCKWVKEGDYCYMKGYVGNVLETDYLPQNSIYTVISEKDIMCVREDEIPTVN